MDTRHLIEGIVQQTTVLIAQISTAAGLRAPLARVADQVFLELAREIEAQGVGRKVVADMFGLALRTYQTVGDAPIGRHLLLQLRGDEQGIHIPRSAIPAPPESGGGYDTAYVVALPAGQGTSARLKSSFGAAQMMFVHVPDPAQLDQFSRDRFVADVAAGIAPTRCSAAACSIASCSRRPARCSS